MANFTTWSGHELFILKILLMPLTGTLRTAPLPIHKVIINAIF